MPESLAGRHVTPLRGAVQGKNPARRALRLLAPAAIAAVALLSSCTNMLPTVPRGQSLVTTVEHAPWRPPGLTGEVLTTPHYNIYTTTHNRVAENCLPGFMERAHDHYLRLTGLRDEPPGSPLAPMYLLGDRGQWAAMTEQITGEQKDTFLAIENGGYCFRGVCVLWDMGHFSTFSVAAHEGLHQFLGRNLRDTLPAWIEEGLCTQMEGFDISSEAVRFDPALNVSRLTSLRGAISSARWIGLEKLLESDAGDFVTEGPTAPEYYAHLWALVCFLRSEPQYRDGLERLLADAATGRLRELLRIPAAMGAGREYSRAISLPVFRRYFDADLPAFERRYRQFATKLAGLETTKTDLWRIW